MLVQVRRKRRTTTKGEPQGRWRRKWRRMAPPFLVRDWG